MKEAGGRIGDNDVHQWNSHEWKGVHIQAGNIWLEQISDLEAVCRTGPLMRATDWKWMRAKAGEESGGLAH